MPEWSNTGVDLQLELVDGERVRAALERQLREAIRADRLPAGTLLPPTRTLATDLGVARNTVAEAYRQLVAEGWLTARQGAGTRVAESPRRPAAQRIRPPAVVSSPYDLRPGYPDLTSFPRGDWLAAARSALSSADRDAWGYADPAGRPELRTALAGYLARARGLHADADHVAVVPGFAGGLGPLARALRRSGVGVIGVEALGHARHREILTANGLTVVPLPVDRHGAAPEGLDRCQAVLLTPAHQFPSGAALSAERRTAFARWAAGSGGWVVEDDYDGEFRYDHRPLGAMQALAPQAIVYAGTASKTLAPALRIGWLVVPDALRPALLDELSLGGGPPTPEQLTLATFIDSTRYDRHVRRMRQAYRRRRDELVAALPGHDLAGLPAGLHAVLPLPEGSDEADVVAAARRRGLLLDGLRDYATDPTADRAALVLGYGTPAPSAWAATLARLAALDLGGT